MGLGDHGFITNSELFKDGEILECFARFDVLRGRFPNAVRWPNRGRNVIKCCISSLENCA